MERANEVVTDYALTETRKAIERVEKIREGEGCICRNCTVEAVNDVNSWISFTEEKKDNVFYRYKVLEDLTVSLITLEEARTEPKQRSIYDDIIDDWDDDDIEIA